MHIFCAKKKNKRNVCTYFALPRLHKGQSFIRAHPVSLAQTKGQLSFAQTKGQSSFALIIETGISAYANSIMLLYNYYNQSTITLYYHQRQGKNDTNAKMQVGFIYTPTTLKKKNLESPSHSSFETALKPEQ